MNPNIRTGTVEGTGAALNVALGFVPDYVRLWNADGDTVIEWSSGMTDGHGIKSTATGPAAITADGISAYEGAQASEGAGFTIGADAGVNESGKDIHYLAVRNGAAG